MKAKFLLGAGLLVSTLGFGQTTYYPTTGSDAAGAGGIQNVHIGNYAGMNDVGEANVFAGFNAGQFNTTGMRNVFIGYAGSSNTVGHDNIFIGHTAGRKNIIGNYNIVLGAKAGINNESSYNSFVGFESGWKNITGEGNSFFGFESGSDATGNYNVYLGYAAGQISKGNRNVSIGRYAGMQGGNGNIFIGDFAGRDETRDNKLYVANTSTPNPLIYGEFGTSTDIPLLKFNAAKVGIGPDFGAFPAMTTIPNASSYRFFVKGGILAEEVRIRLQADWADYVFADDYKLLSLTATEQYINENGHLPNMPSAAQVKEEGIEVGNIIKLQQEKIEELTLHLIEQDKKMEELKAQVQLLLNRK